MLSKLKQLDSQEWAILILFIISIFTLIFTVHLTSSEEENMYVNSMEGQGSNVVTYLWTGK